MPGRHELALLDGAGRVIQSVRFEVRGAGLRQTPPVTSDSRPPIPQVNRSKAQFVAGPWRPGS